MNVVVRHTSAAMAALGADVTVYTRRADTHAAAAERIDGVLVRRLDAGPPQVLPKAAHDDLIEPFAEVLSREPAVDLLHSQHWFSGMAALRIARARGIPHVQSFHSIAAPAATPLSEGERPESDARLAGERWLAGSTDALIAVSQAEATTTLQRLGADPARMHIIHPGVDADLFHPASACLAGSEVAKAPVLLTAARLEPLKAVDLAIRTLAAIPVTAGAPARLLVAGGATSDQDYVDSLEALARDLGVATRVRFLGPQSRDALAALMRAATIVLVPSHSETYGLVALEAAASGVPVVAARAGGLAEAVADGVTGLLLPDWEVPTWADAVGALIAEPQRRRLLGEAGRAHALSRRWSDVAAQTIRTYLTVLGHHHS